MMKKLFAALISAVLMLCCCAPALGENIKHERVYIVAGPDGEIRSLTDSIRLENNDGLDEITDASLLTGIENMSGIEPFTRDGDTLIWQAKGNDIIYQGASDQAPAILPTVSLTLDSASAYVMDNPHDKTFNVAYFEGHVEPYQAPTTPKSDIYHDQGDLKKVPFLNPQAN